jgi:hypothetical protein
LAWFKNRPKSGWTAADWAFLEDPFGAKTKKMVRVMVKNGITPTITISGERYVTRADGTIEVSEDNAKALRAIGYQILPD